MLILIFIIVIQISIDMDKTYWDGFYSTNCHGIKNQSTFAEFIYNNYIKQYNNTNVFLRIADIGCGNGRDSKYFANKGNILHSVDQSNVNHVHENIKMNNNSDAVEYLNQYISKSLVDIVYMRWFLHALPYDVGEQIFEGAVNNLKPNGLICIEVRSIEDKNLLNTSIYDDTDKSYKTSHKRWPYTKSRLLQLGRKYGCDVEILEQGKYSPNPDTETPDPLLIRAVFKKPQNIIQSSPNYQLYCPLYNEAHFKTRLNSAIKDFLKLINYLDENHIRYVAVAGTDLGLNRHGGLVPWDDDIDIAFDKANWHKLNMKSKELAKLGLNSVSCCRSPIHKHVGRIDCFMLTEKKDGWMTGLAKTTIKTENFYNTCNQVFSGFRINACKDSYIHLLKRYGAKWFDQADLNDNFHNHDYNLNKTKFDLDPLDRGVTTILV